MRTEEREGHKRTKGWCRERASRERERAKERERETEWESLRVPPGGWQDTRYKIQIIHQNAFACCCWRWSSRWDCLWQRLGWLNGIGAVIWVEDWGGWEEEDEDVGAFFGRPWRRGAVLMIDSIFWSWGLGDGGSAISLASIWSKWEEREWRPYFWKTCTKTPANMDIPHET